MDQNMNMGGAEAKKPVGAIISIIIIVLLLALGAFYSLRQVPIAPETGEALTPAELQADTTVSSLSAQGTSTDLGDIEKDLNATDFSGVDVGLGNVAL